ncbi:cell wall-binding repeat-containing protein [Clostridium sp.]|uniref:cell wall-binding repeat-containing protein n=1 Tax=Clostridium sp. TaxID=1506 RepID=UPI002FDD244D
MELNEKNKIMTLVSTSLSALILTATLNVASVSAAAGQVSRTSGASRYETAAQVALNNWTTSDNIVLVCGEGYADAVSASTLAKKLDAPILLTEAASLSAPTEDALSKLKTKNIYIIGGYASVSKEVRDSLKDTYKLIELGGSNRYETNTAVAEELVGLGVDPSNAMLVGGNGFSDALSAAPIAAAKGQILLLGMNDPVSIKPVTDFIAKYESQVTVAATTNVINNDIFTAVNGVARVNGGSDRFDTNLKVLNSFKADLKFDKAYIANASGNGYADALVASSLAAKSSAPLLLVDTENSDATSNAIAYLKSNITSTIDIQVIGGTSVVSGNVVDKINALFTPNTSTLPKVTIEQVGTAILGKTVVIASFPSDVDATEYDVTIDGQSFTYDTSTKKLVLVLNGTFTEEQLQAKVVVSKK